MEDEARFYCIVDGSIRLCRFDEGGMFMVSVALITATYVRCPQGIRSEVIARLRPVAGAMMCLGLGLLGSNDIRMIMVTA